MKRRLVQVISALLTNGYFKGFVDGKIYKGVTKSVCLPGLNCYSCPGALGSCPIGSLQAVIGSMKYQWSYYVVGIMMVYGSLLGRWICGWLCPFGLVQDLIEKVPIRKRKLPSYIKYVKYIVLALFVILLPMIVTNAVGMSDPWFCKYICPSGTLLGAIPLLSKNEGLRSALGYLFTWKVTLLLLIIIGSMFYRRFFCKVLCPLGAVYGLFNKISLYRYNIDERKCSTCKKCQKVCPMDVVPYKTPNSMECIRCGQCISACKSKCIQVDFLNKGENKI